LTPSLGTGAFRSGFVTIVGRPNVGKSTLLNRLVGTKVAIVSDRPQTTRTQIRGVRTTPSTQIVFLDTPGIHKPRTRLGERTNERAQSTLAEVDAVCLLVDATAPIGRGDRFIADLVAASGTPAVLVVNKVDDASRDAIAEHLTVGGELGDFAAYVPLSGLTGENLDALVGELEGLLPEGPHYYPDGVVSDQPETVLAAELVREKLLARAREELPHSIAVTVEELDDDERSSREDILRLRAVIRVERDSQKGIVIGKGGAVLRDAGTEARTELEALLGTRIYLETSVRVDRDWQRKDQSLDRLGF
jgi:GTP-binding protein Era